MLTYVQRWGMAIIEYNGLASWHLIGQLCLFPTNVVKDEIDMIAPIVSSHKYIFGMLEPSPPYPLTGNTNVMDITLPTPS